MDVGKGVFVGVTVSTRLGVAAACVDVGDGFTGVSVEGIGDGEGSPTSTPLHAATETAVKLRIARDVRATTFRMSIVTPSRRRWILRRPSTRLARLGCLY